MPRFKSALYGIISGLSVILVIVVIGALTYLKYDYDYRYVSLIMQGAYVLGSFVAGFICGRLFEKNGIISGLITSTIIGIICIGASLLFGNKIITLSLILTTVIIFGAGISGGVVSLNVGKNKSL